MGTTRKRARRWDGPGQPAVARGVSPVTRAPGEARIGQALRGHVQTKLAISRPGDASEQEADRAAEAVVRGLDARTLGRSGSPPLVQRACSDCEQEQDEQIARKAVAIPDSEEEKKRREEEERAKAKKKEEAQDHERRREREDEEGMVHAKRDGDGPGTASAQAEAEARALNQGSPLPDHLRGFFEARFGRRFDGVRLHTGAQAAEATRALGALAFALRDHVAFAPGQFQPDTAAGLKLLAHELAHVVQQGHAPALDATSDTSSRTRDIPAATGTPSPAPGRGDGGRDSAD